MRPASRELPTWFLNLQSGDPRAFDAVVASSAIPRNPARWLRFLLLVAGDIEPHPVPKIYKPRGEMSLDVSFAPETAGRMKRCLSAFRLWLETELKISWDTLIAEPAAAWRLRSYGLDLFERGLPRYLLVYAITGMQDTYPQVRQHLHIAWQVDRKMASTRTRPLQSSATCNSYTGCYNTGFSMGVALLGWCSLDWLCSYAASWRISWAYP